MFSHTNLKRVAILFLIQALFTVRIGRLLKRTLNPLLARYFFVNCNIQPKNDIYPDSVDAKSVYVVTKW